MLTDCAVLRSASPICSAIDMNRLLNTSSSTGSASAPRRLALARGDAAHDEMIVGADFEPPAWLDHHRLVRLDDAAPGR